MAGLVVTIKTEGLVQVTIALRGLKNRALDLTVPLKQAGTLMLRSVSANFRQGGRPVPWRPLAFSTLKRKLRQGYSPIPLTRTGHLQRSITYHTSQTRLLIGTSVPYAAVHQFGGRAGRNLAARIPARPYLRFQREDLNRIRTLIVKHLTGAAANG